MNIPAVFILAMLSALLIRGTRESAFVNGLIVILKVSIVIMVISVGWGFIDPANHTPFIPEATSFENREGITHAYGGLMGILGAAGVVFFAYIGFDAVSTAAQEAKNPKRDMPIGILASLAICTVLYITVALILTGIVHYSELNVPDPIAVGINALGPGMAWLRPIVKIGAIAGLSSVILVMMLGQPRIFFTMSKDGLLPPLFSAVHPRFRTPWLATLLTGAVAMMVAGLFPIGLLGELVSIGTLLAFVIVCAGVLVLRITDPEVPRPFRTPGYPIVPAGGVLACGYLMYGLPPDTWARLIIWMAVGLLIYFLYGRRHSKVQRRLARRV